MKTLYITDLDGTLLDANAEVSACTEVTLNALIDKGMQFSIASARTAATVVPLMQKVHLTLPMILMNGVCMYDPQSSRFLDLHRIPPASLRRLLGILRDFGQSGFLYSCTETKLETYYEQLDSPQAKAFYEERVKRYNKPFVKVDSFADLSAEDMVYFSVCDRHCQLFPVYEALQDDPDVRVEYYHDVYREDYRFLEVFAGTASKKNAVQALRERGGFDRVVAFGDNYNDLPMFEAADVSIAVANARESVRQAADVVIGENTGDSVAQWLQENASFE